MRDRAAEIVARVAGRLDDPAGVAAIAAPGPGQPAWAAASLTDGYPGIAVLHAELGRRRDAHRYLAAAARAALPVAGHGLSGGLPALLFAARAAVVDPRDYAGLLGRLAAAVSAAARDRVAQELVRIGAGRAGTSFACYDVLTGLTGVGRVLLRCGHPVAEEIVAYLVALTRPARLGAATVPGWYVGHGPVHDAPTGTGHLNLGLAHGVAGPLALLAIADRDGLQLPGQREAIERVVAWLLGSARWDEHGPYWPDTASVGGVDADRGPGRPAWCYGTPGTARAVYLAGAALDQVAWQETAVAALRGVLARPRGRQRVRIAGRAGRRHGASAEVPQRPRDGWATTDPGLCHGWAGLLQLTWRVARDSGDARLADGVDELASRLVGCFDPDAPFGFRYGGSAGGAVVAADRPGMVNGAAGTALALHTYASDRDPRSGWDTALLLS